MRVYHWYTQGGDWTVLSRLPPADLDEAEKFAMGPVSQFVNGVTRDGVIEQINIIRDLRAMGLSL